MDKEKYLDLARKFYNENFVDAQCGFVAGSIMRGEGVPHSDIDLVVMYDDDYQDVHRESHIYEGAPIEVFVNNRQSQDYFFEHDGKKGVPSMASMVSEGIIIGRNIEVGQVRKEIAKRILKNGPEPLTKDELNRMRYMITDLIDDLCDPRPRGAVLGILAKLYLDLGTLYLRGQNQWTGSGKSMIKRITSLDAAFAKSYVAAFDMAYAGDAAPVIALGNEILAPYGGRYWGGDYQKASDDWKSHTNEIA